VTIKIEREEKPKVDFMIKPMGGQRESFVNFVLLKRQVKMKSFPSNFFIKGGRRENQGEDREFCLRKIIHESKVIISKYLWLTFGSRGCTAREYRLLIQV
jgi:hypothetical protein